ncbi:MAG: GNAT family N-acetyltransferase [Flavobacteriaceae bacterium]|nr:GNAT family N-acetyltransferase [Bacteroidia bacterium]NNK88377.1 GNAT family N-acetyltransferase [Flavobacteriaceae bacterium]
MKIVLRKADPDDVFELTTLFRETVSHINSRDYSEEQIKHWISSADDIPKWEKRIKSWYFIVAESGKTIVGFAYLNDGNYFDGLFVHHKYQGKGIATLLADRIEKQAETNGFDSVHSDVSLTARKFFEKRGYTIEALQQKTFRGMIFENYIVSKKF